MHLKKLFAALILTLSLVPIATSAQSISLSIEARQQLLGFAQQLVQILSELAQARAYGEAYLSSTAFAQQSLGWTTKLIQIQQQVSVIVTTALANPTPTYPPTTTPPSSACPSFYRDLTPGMQGSDVVALQQFLARDPSRFSGAVTGVFDTATLVGVQRFQAAYGIKTYGEWNVTGYGRVGPITRSSIMSVCARTPYTPPLPPPAPTTGTFSSQPGTASKSIVFTVRANPSTSCGGSTFTLYFGDGTEEQLNFSGSCSTQTRTVTHSYASTGTYTVRLRSGSFETADEVVVTLSNYTLSLQVDPGDTSYEVDLKATYDPGSSCAATDYTLDWGDGTDRVITFSGASCDDQTKTYSHTYASGGTYQIKASDSRGNISRITFTTALDTTVPQPTASFSSGNYTAPITGLILSKSGSATSIKWTTDSALTLACTGDATTGNLYSDPLNFAFNRILRAISCSAAGVASSASTFTYTFSPVWPVPTATPAPGTVSAGTPVTLSSSGSHQVRYKINPTSAFVQTCGTFGTEFNWGTVYTGPITNSGATLIRAWSCSTSGVASATVDLEYPACVSTSASTVYTTASSYTDNCGTVYTQVSGCYVNNGNQVHSSCLISSTPQYYRDNRPGGGCGGGMVCSRSTGEPVASAVDAQCTICNKKFIRP